ncbi:hypothetical protein KKE75_04590, partial [Patescibacteria group bacterium]|nr:hypothetical protein [Patescibacteria group bacterium]
MKKGFIDPISLITIGFLIVGLVVTTAIVKNPESFDIRQWAYELEDEELKFLKRVQTPKQPAKPAPAKPPAAPTAILEPEETRFIQQEAVKQTAPALQPAATTTVPICGTGLTCVNRGGNSCQGNETSCKQTSTGPTICCEAAGTTAPTTTIPVTTAPTQACTPNCGCAATTYKGSTCGNGCGGICPGTKCRPDGTACGTGASNCCSGSCNTNNACTAIPAPITKCSSFGSCYPANYTCEKDYGQMDCGRASRCGIHCSAPAPAPITITKSDYQKCLDDGNTPGECSPVAQNIGKTITTPTGQKECDPNKDKPFCSGNNLKTCSASGTWGLQTCQYDCENNACKSAPAPAKKVDSNAGLIATYKTLDAVTFGAFGNYVQTYQDINTQNPQASYLQQAFNPQGIAAATQLGVVLTAEAAIVASFPQATAGLGALATTPVVAAANLVDDTATAIACAKGNQNA